MFALFMLAYCTDFSYYQILYIQSLLLQRNHFINIVVSIYFEEKYVVLNEPFSEKKKYYVATQSVI